MYCKKCGNKIEDDAKFCTKCGFKIETEETDIKTTRKKLSNNGHGKFLKKVIVGSTVIFLGTFCVINIEKKIGKTELASTYEDKKASNKVGTDYFKEYLINKYGVADNPVYGSIIEHSEIESGIVTKTDTQKFKDGSNGGLILYKELSCGKKLNESAFVYLSDSGTFQGISLNIGYECEENKSQNGISFEESIATPKLKNHCFAIVGHDLLVSVELEEEIDSSDKKIYNEIIVIRELTHDRVNELYTISRKLTLGVNELKEYKITKNSETIVYTEGFGNYTFEGATFISTEQEFNDKVNEILGEDSLECIKVQNMCWDSRWNGVKVDKNLTKADVVEMDFSTSEPYLDENGDKVTDITITESNKTIENPK